MILRNLVSYTAEISFSVLQVEFMGVELLKLLVLGRVGIGQLPSIRCAHSLGRIPSPKPRKREVRSLVL
jgi:hypothetical protein